MSENLKILAGQQSFNEEDFAELDILRKQLQDLKKQLAKENDPSEKLTVQPDGESIQIERVLTKSQEIEDTEDQATDRLKATNESSQRNKETLQVVYIRQPGGTIRANPGMDATVKFYLDPGSQAFLTGIRENWYAIISEDGRVGWGHRNIFSNTPVLKNREEPVTSKTREKLTVQPDGESIQIEGVLTKSRESEDTQGQAADRLKATNGSSQINTETLQVVYIRQPGGTIRANPGMDATVKFYLDPGAQAFLTDIRDNWYAIISEDGRVGWGHRNIFSNTPVLKNREEPVTSKTIEKISVQTISAQETRVLFELSTSEAPEGFTIEGEWPRVVFDFLGTQPGNDLETTMRIADGIIDRIRLGVHNNPQSKLRVVIDMRSGSDYAVGQTLLLGSNKYIVTIKKLN